jgi:hypothetical protein
MTNAHPTQNFLFVITIQTKKHKVYAIGKQLEILIDAGGPQERMWLCSKKHTL